MEYSGLIVESMHIDGSRAVLHFSHVGGGLVAHSDALSGFTAAGADGVFPEAAARIERDTVVVILPDTATPPATVRNAWANVAAGNLFNADGLPASPFRTDVD